MITAAIARTIVAQMAAVSSSACGSVSRDDKALP
jgi:hypothetical protein